MQGYEWLFILAMSMGLPLIAIVDMFRWRPATWAAARQSRPLWVALSLLLGPLGALLYFTGPRLVLRRAIKAERPGSSVRN